MFALLFIIGKLNIIYAENRTTSVSWISNFGNWSVNRDKYFCYAISSPIISKPSTNINHGNNYFIIASNPEKKGSYVLEAVMDYPLDKNKNISLQVKGKNSNEKIFTMNFYNDHRTIFPPESDNDVDLLIKSMKMGKDLILKAKSKRGTDTEYVYSLNGLSKALEDIGRCQE
ncbi:hypothetical protein [Candidatus Liberibacter americanus]|uniref:Uncharacterized protein n=1 Tax=Candidatus Liberibacter americanus str. Sao Paulo TaxID=1261131 RepID=U6B5J9_9HYPH|nr:hypothetical protein [Candidatus Liberibacter americanus]AHA28053.1 hypothetical protein lam_707 [Candidatus Liberibacter americanus str. Sao Paulo]EMS35977.1 hypothetical protein G653_04012 [Candidatus Liberibacter americanus PW_SP]